MTHVSEAITLIKLPPVQIKDFSSNLKFVPVAGQSGFQSQKFNINGHMFKTLTPSKLFERAVVLDTIKQADTFVDEAVKKLTDAFEKEDVDLSQKINEKKQIQKTQPQFRDKDDYAGMYSKGQQAQPQKKLSQKAQSILRPELMDKDKYIYTDDLHKGTPAHYDAYDSSHDDAYDSSHVYDDPNYQLNLIQMDDDWNKEVDDLILSGQENIHQLNDMIEGDTYQITDIDEHEQQEKTPEKQKAQQEKTPEKQKAQSKAIDDMNVIELKTKAKELGLSNYSKLKRTDLLEMIKSHVDKQNKIQYEIEMRKKNEQLFHEYSQYPIRDKNVVSDEQLKAYSELTPSSNVFTASQVKDALNEIGLPDTITNKLNKKVNIRLLTYHSKKMLNEREMNSIKNKLQNLKSPPQTPQQETATDIPLTPDTPQKQAADILADAFEKAGGGKKGWRKFPPLQGPTSPFRRGR